MIALYYQNFPDALKCEIPGFSRIYDEHIRNYDRLLPHVLLANLVRFLSEELRLRGPQSTAIRSALTLLEQGMGSADPMLQELVAVSFLENLDSRLTLALQSDFGPNLKEQYQKYQSKR